MRQKQVLLAIERYREPLHKAFMAYARESGWQVRVAIHWLPRNWYGDGVASDFFEAEQLSVLRGGWESRPLVTRTTLQGPLARQVFNDAEAAARLAVAYLRGKGFRDLGVVSCGTWKSQPSSYLERIAAEQGVCLHWPARRLGILGQDFAGALKAVAAFLRGLPQPCAVFSDYLEHADIVSRACREEGIEVPQQLALICASEDPLVCECFSPTLTTVAGSDRQVGLEMARLLDRLMAGEQVPPNPVLVQPEGVVERESTNILAVRHLPTARAVRYAIAHCDSPIGIRHMARAAGMGETALRRRFRTHLGMSPHAFLRTVRMDRARRLLLDTDDTLAAIASRTGYSSAITFSLAFKQTHGQTPGAYRSEHTPTGAHD